MRVDEDAYFAGVLRAYTLVPSAACIHDSHVAEDAEIDAEKTRHRHTIKYADVGSPGDAAAIPLHCVPQAATAFKFRAGFITVPTTADSVEIDLLKGGATILTGPIVLDDNSVSRVMQEGVFDDADLSAGDWLDLSIDYTNSGGANGVGLLVELVIDEPGEAA